MKVGNIVKWSGDQSTSGMGMVIDTCMINGLPHATVFWFDYVAEANHLYMDLTTISRA